MKDRNEEADFLRAILSDPKDRRVREDYAVWLERRADPGTRLVRMDPELARISCVAWLEKCGELKRYLHKFPEVTREWESRQAMEPFLKERIALGEVCDPSWLAFMDTLGCPFQPFYFFNNHGVPKECAPHELPFTEPIGTRGALLTFESDFRDGGHFDEGLLKDLRFLAQLDLGECAYGAASCPVHPFLCELKDTGQNRLTGLAVLKSLRARELPTRQARWLKDTSLPSPGRDLIDDTGKEDNEIHNDFDEQFLFPRGDEDSEEEPDETDGTHGRLKNAVVGGQLWYVLLHTAPTPVEDTDVKLSRYAVLFAVGRSKNGNRLMGVASHQVCHNLCH
jgi:hypothetical protein